MPYAELYFTVYYKLVPIYLLPFKPRAVLLRIQFIMAAFI